jgi:hypothetical protein
MNKQEITVVSNKMRIEEIATEQLANITGGVDCDSLRGATGAFKPENPSETAAARACIEAGHPLVKKLF